MMIMNANVSYSHADNFYSHFIRIVGTSIRNIVYAYQCRVIVAVSSQRSKGLGEDFFQNYWCYVRSVGTLSIAIVQGSAIGHFGTVIAYHNIHYGSRLIAITNEWSIEAHVHRSQINTTRA